MSNPRKYLDQLFISKVRIKAIKHFFMSPDEPIHLRGAVRELNEEINAVRRELARMESIHLLVAEQRGNRKYFRLNPDFVFYDELLGLVFKTFGLGGEIITNAKKIGDIKYALLTQSYTHHRPQGSHPVDLVIVGQVDLNELGEIVAKEEKRLDREIHYTVLGLADFETRRHRRDTFVQELMLQNRVMLIGNSVDFITDTKA
jgi:hypothetical protein